MQLFEEIIVYLLTFVFIYLIEGPSATNITVLIMYKIMATLFYNLVLKKIIFNVDQGKIVKMLRYWPRKIRSMLE